MATIRKTKNKTWLVEVRKFGQYRSKTFDTKIRAMAWAVEIEQEITPDAIIQGKTLEETFKRYQQEVTPYKKGWKFEHDRLNKFCRTKFSSILLSDIRQCDFDLWIASELKRIKASSVNRDLNLLSAVFEQAKRWQWINNNPIRGIRRPKNPPPRDRRISNDEIDRILLALNYDGEIKEQRHEVAVAFLFAIETAMRQGEIWGLDWKNVFLDKRFVKLFDTKNGSNRDVPLSSDAINLLEKLKSQKQGRVFLTNQQSSATIYRRAVKMAGIEGLTFHDTRHEALTRLAQKLDVLDLARMVGHRDPRSLMIYYNPTAEELAAKLG